MARVAHLVPSGDHRCPTAAPWHLPLVLLKSLRRLTVLEGVLQGALSVIQWFWCYMIMSKKTCHLLPIFWECGWEWAIQGRLELSLDPTDPTPHPPWAFGVKC